MQHAVAVLMANLLGLGVGPTAVALITDYGFADATALPQALAIALPVMLVTALAIYLMANRLYTPLGNVMQD